MNPRLRRLLIYFLLCLTPLLALAVFNYWNSVRTVDQTLGATLQDNVNALTGEVDTRLQQDETDLSRLSLSTGIQRFLDSSVSPTIKESANQGEGPEATTANLPDDLRVSLAYALGYQSHLLRLMLIDSRGGRMLRAEPQTAGADTPFKVYQESSLTGDARSALSALSNKQRTISLAGSNLKVTIPLLQERSPTLVGALIGELDLSQVFADAASPLESNAGLTGLEGSTVMVLDSSGRIIYHTNHVLEGQSASDALPEFRNVITQTASKQNGIQTIHSPNGPDQLAALAWLPRINISVALSHRRSPLVSVAHRWGIAGLVFAVGVAFLAAFIWERYEDRKLRSIERVTEDLDAIARGELDRRIELKSSDEARAIADNINIVTQQLREQIAREAESRQFESFVRLSAMLTHDLKNAIEALSLTVGNMEQHFDNEQFRADAMKSVAGATEKLKAVVARLTRPLTSLSGEHKRPGKVDLVPLLKRVVSRIAAPVEDKHKIEVKLPASAIALVDAQRIEAVIENLVLNAVEAMSEKPGTLTIEAADLSDGKVMFSISDTGIGISPSFIEQRLFRAFATTKKRGVGLGLYTCREIVRASGGSIEVTSVQGAGTSFRVVLPSTEIDGRNQS